MIRFTLRLVGLLLLAGAFAAAVIDGARSLADQKVELSSMGTVLAYASPAKFALMVPLKIVEGLLKVKVPVVPVIEPVLTTVALAEPPPVLPDTPREIVVTALLKAPIFNVPPVTAKAVVGMALLTPRISEPDPTVVVPV